MFARHLLVAWSLAALLPRPTAAQLGGDVPPPPPGESVCRLLTWDAAAAARPSPSPLLRVIDRAERHELVFEVGPVDVPAGGMPREADVLSNQLVGLPFDAWFHGFRLELVDAAGRAVPRVVLHHIDLARPDNRDLFLPVTQRVLAIGVETQPALFPARLLGVPLRAGERMLVGAMIHNPTDTAYAGLRVRVVLAYTRERPLIQVYGFRLDVMFPVGAMDFDLPPGRTVRSWEGSPQVQARVIGVGGHLHRYAEWLELADATTGRVLYRVRPLTDSAGEIHEVPVLLFPGAGVPLDPSHRYRVTASYFNPSGRLIPAGGMAKVGGAFAPAEPLPAADRDHPLYRRDLEHILRTRCGERRAAAPEAHAHEHL